MVAETIHAAVINFNQHGEPFSFKGRIQDSGNGLIENSTSYAALLRDGLFREETRKIDGRTRTVIFPTPLLIEKLKQFFKLPPYDVALRAAQAEGKTNAD